MEKETKKIMLDLRVEQYKLSTLLEYVLRENTPTNRSEFGRMLVSMLYNILKKNGLLKDDVDPDFYEQYWSQGLVTPDVKVDFDLVDVDTEEQDKLLGILKDN